MIYCYRCPACNVLSQKDFRMGAAPGNVACPSCSAIAERSWSDEGPKINADYQSAANKYPYVSHRLPRNMPGAPHDSSGKPVVLSQRHEREIAARQGLRRE